LVSQIRVRSGQLTALLQAQAAGCQDGFSGQHAGDLVIADEASGVPTPIWSATHGLAARLRPWPDLLDALLMTLTYSQSE
jgi:hypothetical protein